MADAPDRPLSPRQQQFVAEYLIDLNATQAAIRAGYSAKNADKIGPRMVGQSRIAAAIQAAQAKRAHRLEITADRLVRQHWDVATADPNELVQHRRQCCRYCYGAEHDYQRTRGELARERRKWEAGQAKNSKDVFDEQGGDGFIATRDPNPDCPECFGVGVGETIVLDTRKLSPAARALYAGVKQTKDGVEVKMHDQTAARIEVGKLLGYYQAPEPYGDPIEVARAVRAAMRAMDAADGLDVAA